MHSKLKENGYWGDLIIFPSKKKSGIAVMTLNVFGWNTSVYYAFFYCSSLTAVNYEGTEEEWNAITIEQKNESLTNATINYNYKM